MNVLALWFVLGSTGLGGAAPQQAEPPAAEAEADVLLNDSVQTAVGQAVAAPAASAQTATGLPMRAPEPPTMARFWPVYGIFALAWVGITAYLLKLGGRIRNVERLLARKSSNPPHA